MGDCRHGRTPEWCPECLRAENAQLRLDLAHYAAELEMGRAEAGRRRDALRLALRTIHRLGCPPPARLWEALGEEPPPREPRRAAPLTPGESWAVPPTIHEEEAPS